MIDRQSPIPYYFQIKEDIICRIDQGELRPGDMLPSEDELGTQYGVSRTTVRKALRELMRDKYVRRAKGARVYVSDPFIEVNLKILTGFVEDMARSGRVSSGKLLERDTVPAEAELAEKLDVAPGAELIKFGRVRLGNGQPLVLRWSHIPAARCPGLLDKLTEDVYLYGLLDQEYGLKPHTSRAYLDAMAADDYTARHLDIAAGDPVLCWTGVIMDSYNVPFEHVRILYRADKYKFYVEQKRPSQLADMWGG